ncbi:MAG: hypothetical protein JO034_07255 [Singulisphaera sp.]|nr:hypothetical protein [Singulisphaera sp.]
MRRSRVMGLVGLAVGLSGCAGTTQCRVAGQQQVQVARAQRLQPQPRPSQTRPQSWAVGDTRMATMNAAPLGVARYFPTFEEWGRVEVNPWEIARPDPLGVRAPVIAGVPPPGRPRAEVSRVSVEAAAKLPAAMNIPAPSSETPPPAAGARARTRSLDGSGMTAAGARPQPTGGAGARRRRVPGAVRPAEVEPLMEPDPTLPPTAPSAPRAPAAPAPDATSMSEAAKGKRPAEDLTLAGDGAPAHAGRLRWKDVLARQRPEAPTTAKSDRGLQAAFLEADPAERLVPVPREEPSRGRLRSMMARISQAIRKEFGEVVSARGEADNVAERRKGVQRVAADRLDESAKR